jgi:ferredoxin
MYAHTLLLVALSGVLALCGAFRAMPLSVSAGVRLTSALSAVKHKVTILHEGSETVLEVAENISILEAALDAGVELPHDCKLGVCLTCPSRVVSGLVDQTGSSLDDSVMEAGFALTCITYPRSDVVITSIDEEELVSAQFSGR